MMGLSPILSNGFGVLSVSGLSLSPLPPAIITASTGRVSVTSLKSSILTNLISLSNSGTNRIFFFLKKLIFSSILSCEN